MGLVAVATASQAAFEIGGGGARAFAVGQACTADIGGAESVWYNAAANARSGRAEAGLAYAQLYPGLAAGLSLSALSVTLPVAGGGLQAAASTLGTDDWSEAVEVAGYGRAVGRRLGLGANLRSSGWETTGMSRRSWGVDVGATYEVGWVHPQVHVRLALAIGNLTRANIAAGGWPAGETPRQFALGASFEGGQRTLLVDVVRRGRSTRLRAGYEARMSGFEGAVLRFGGQASQRQANEVDVGLGQRWQQWQVDYAYAYPLRVSGLGGIHWISVGYRPR